MAVPQKNDSHIYEIKKEYEKIDRDWLTLHYKVSVGFVLFAFIVECLMGIIIIHSDFLNTSISRYILKFIVFPSGVNFCCILFDTLFLRSRKLNQNQKIFAVSFSFVLICFMLFTAHSAFVATYYIFAVAMFMTTIYASYYVTVITCVASITGLVLSELFIRWDVDKQSVFESTLRLGDFLVALAVLTAVAVVCLVQIRYERKKNGASIQKEIERQKLQKKVQTDELTGAMSRKALHDAMRDIDADTQTNLYILVVADIDHFKLVNDNFGHQHGDMCLIAFSEILQSECDPHTVFRYGGDEFCLLFCNVEMEQVVAACWRMLKKIEALKFEAEPESTLTASFGIAAFHPPMNTAQLFVQADQALYRAKETRNTVCVHEPQTTK